MRYEENLIKLNDTIGGKKKTNEYEMRRVKMAGANETISNMLNTLKKPESIKLTATKGRDEKNGTKKTTTTRTMSTTFTHIISSPSQTIENNKVAI